MMMKTINTLALCFCLLLFVGACDSDSNEGELPGTGGDFEAQVSGDLSLSLSGISGFAFGTNAQTGEQAFQVSMNTTSGAGTGAILTLALINNGRPATGTRSIADFDALSGDFSGQVIGTFQFNSMAFLSDSGTLTINESESNRVQGAFSMQASTFTGPGLPAAQSITITGEFDANGIEVTQ